MRINRSSAGRIALFVLFAIAICAVVGYHIYDENFTVRSVPQDQRSREKVIFFGGEALQINYDADANPYDRKLFSRDENNYLVYNDPAYDTKLGIDVSYYQGDIDWKAVKAAGIDYAIVRVGYRGYTVGGLNKDLFLADNLRGAASAGLDVGVYMYSQAISVEEALEEADYVLNLIKNYRVTYPVVYDWEPVYDEESRTNDIDGKTMTDCAIAFCDRIRDAGYTPMIYTYRNQAYLKYELERLNDYDLWIAEYNRIPTYYYDYEMIQFTNTGSVPGVSTDVDINLSFRDYAKE